MKRNDAFFAPKSASYGGTLHAAHPPPEAGASVGALDREPTHSPAAHEDDFDRAVTIGSTVEILDLEANELEVYVLVHPDHADIRRNRISSFTPVGRALFGRRAGEIVEVEGPTGSVNIRIENIHGPSNGNGESQN